jgi:hypothetical protein
MATLRPAPLSALRPTSPIARNTRHAADFRQALSAARGPRTTCTAIAGYPRGGRFAATAAAAILPRPRNRRDATCSRRS